MKNTYNEHLPKCSFVSHFVDFIKFAIIHYMVHGNFVSYNNNNNNKKKKNKKTTTINYYY